MSWCGGGEISPTPGVLWRILPMYSSTFVPDSAPPSPGLAPWAILICSSLALTRYSVVTPKRADAVHRDREVLVRRGADRPERHRAGDEPLDEFLRRLDLLERDRLADALLE